MRIARLLSIVAALPGLLTCRPSPSPTSSPAAPTTLQTTLERHGDMTVKEFHPVGTLAGESDRKAKVQAVVVSVPWDSTRTFGLRIEVGEGDETEIGFLDADEAAALLRAADYIIAKAPGMARDTLDYTEVTYTSRAGVAVGFYQTGTTQTAFLHISNSVRGFMSFDPAAFSKLRVIVAAGVDRLKQLGWKVVT